MLCHLAEHSVCHNQTAKVLFQHLTALYIIIAHSTGMCKKALRSHDFDLFSIKLCVVFTLGALTVSLPYIVITHIESMRTCMRTFIIGGKTASIFLSTKPEAPVIYLNTFSGEGQKVFEAAQAAGFPSLAWSAPLPALPGC